MYIQYKKVIHMKVSQSGCLIKRSEGIKKSYNLALHTIKVAFKKMFFHIELTFIELDFKQKSYRGEKTIYKHKRPL